MLKPFDVVSDYVPAGLDATDWSQLEPLYRGLLGRELHCANCLRGLIFDRSELDAAVSEAGSVLYINMTCHTDDAAVKKAYLDFVENVQPRLKEASFELDRKVVASPFGGELDQKQFGILMRDTKAAVELFRPENIPIETELTKLDQQYSEICGAMTVRFRGSEHTLPQMAKYQEETDRGTREEAWRLVTERRLKDKAAIEDIFDKMLELRGEVARNAGFANYRDFAFKAKRRFDYTAEDCHSFAEGVEKHVVPALRRLSAERKALLKVERLRPWDMGVDEHGMPPLKPFRDGADLLARTQKMFREMDASAGGLGQMFDAIAAPPTAGSGQACLDLESRKGKAPGGYQANRDKMRLPFIFMNAAGVHKDVVTMVHEAGHAFHAILCRHDPVLANRSEIPLEFAEVASMSMELTCLPFMDEFYAGAEVERARRQQFVRLAELLPWVATIDQFQHWLYTHEGHTRAQRRAEWLRLRARFGEDVDWTGLEEPLALGWQRQMHLFGAPFYYIEYGIAQLGALQMYGNYRKDSGEALRRYKEALALGGSRRLPELFSAAGLAFDLSPERIASAWGEVEREMAQGANGK